MIELDKNRLTFQFHRVHRDAEFRLDFQRTLRIPDDNRGYPLPPGLGRFPIEHVDDYAGTLPEQWRRHGGVFIPMYQSEALWLNFRGSYPCAVKVAAGKVNAVSGEAWRNGLSNNPQDYVVLPDQPWLDGFNVGKGYIRQFVAMPLGAGFTAEEQITGEAAHGGLQIVAYPMKREVYLKRFAGLREAPALSAGVCTSASPEMGLAPGGLMRQEIFEDEHGIDAWDQSHALRCFVHLVNSEIYRALTGREPPQSPPTAREYSQAGLPWFEHYGEGKALPGAEVLSRLTSVAGKLFETTQQPMPDNEPVQPAVVKRVGNKKGVRDGEF